jgi:hypothetical protein
MPEIISELLNRNGNTLAQMNHNAATLEKYLRPLKSI